MFVTISENGSIELVGTLCPVNISDVTVDASLN